MFNAFKNVINETFNRTILELKLDCATLYLRYLIPFNRTILELKFQTMKKQEQIEYTFNRTILELKSW